MHLAKGLLAGLVAAGVVACSNSAAGQPGGPSASGQPAANPSPTAAAQAGHAAAPFDHSEPKTKAGARAAAARFYGLYSASQLAVSWDLLAPAAKRQIPRDTWVRVHDGCQSGGAGKDRIIKSVTVFGDAAIVTQKITGAHLRHRTARDVFNYAKGHWGFSPGDLSIYQHGSVAADIAAAKAAGFCNNRKNSML